MVGAKECLCKSCHDDDDDDDDDDEDYALDYEDVKRLYEMTQR